MQNYREQALPQYIPSFYEYIDSAFNGDCRRYAEYLYDHSQLLESDKPIYVNRPTYGSDKGVEYGVDLIDGIMRLMADIRDDMTDIDEQEMMVSAVKAIQGITDTPLQLDTTDPKALEAGLRIYNGKPIVNSVNGEEESLQTVLPLVKKYGAAVVGLTLDKGGIPKTAEGRFLPRHPPGGRVYRLPDTDRIGRAGGRYGNAPRRDPCQGGARTAHGLRRVEHLVRTAEP